MTWLGLALLFTQLSFMAFGGVVAILPEMHRQVVDVHHWMTAQDFTNLFALSQAAPGPNIMIAPLIGWHVAGWMGLLVTSLAMFGPTSVLTLLVMKIWNRFKDKPWRKAVQQGLAPITVGLMATSAQLMVRTTDHNWRLALLTACATLLAMNKRLHPLWILAGGALLGIVIA